MISRIIISLPGCNIFILFCFFIGYFKTQSNIYLIFFYARWIITEILLFIYEHRYIGMLAASLDTKAH
jgi:hypothetical protein